jgi:hypothetical protein
MQKVKKGSHQPQVTNLKSPTTNHLPATSRQPPSHYHHLLMFTLEL